MEEPDELTVLKATIEICDETSGGAGHELIAARLGVDDELVQSTLLPRIARYFEVTMPGDDGIGAVHGPTAEARRIVGPR